MNNADTWTVSAFSNILNVKHYAVPWLPANSDHVRFGCEEAAAHVSRRERLFGKLAAGHIHCPR